MIQELMQEGKCNGYVPQLPFRLNEECVCLVYIKSFALIAL
jgi:hypothetical protein